ncbi:MAG: DNA-formamidopyrimidine glycosylase family protein [Polyangiales bacterium]
MPELPDVEHYKRYLDATSLHLKIAGVHIGTAKILRGVSGRKLTQALRGRCLDRTLRHGKHLFVALDDGNWLRLHFGMTGSFLYFKNLDDDPEHDRMRLDFKNGYHLAFDDQRLFGQVGLIKDPDAFIATQGLGPDAMDASLDQEAFLELMNERKGGIKSALMDQSLLAGIGNLYADEILFQAKVHPDAPVGKLSLKTLRKLYATMRRVLQVAIDRGAGSEELANKLPRTYLLPNRKAGRPCPRCGGAIQTTKTAGRTTYYCPRCQRKP